VKETVYFPESVLKLAFSGKAFGIHMHGLPGSQDGAGAENVIHSSFS
jgi:hypothetical protein